MRITTQMLNESARKAGQPINRTSLLNYINTENSQNPLINALNKKNNSVDTKKQENYEKLEKNADTLYKQTDIFTIEGEASIFAKAKAGGSNQEIYDNIEALVKSYNNTMKALSDASTALNDFYRDMLKEAAGDNAEALNSIGITQSKDGTLSIDSEKLKTADVDTLEKIFGASGDFVKKTDFLAERILDNAKTNTENLTNRYDSSGNIYAGNNNRYNFWG